jgi:hydroxyquinol 1,2-dioxygenase
MLTDLLGISELVELLQDSNDDATEANLQGPTYVPNSPQRCLGDRLGVDEEGDPLFLSGQVLDRHGQAIANALIEVWQPNSKGLYESKTHPNPLATFADSSALMRTATTPLKPLCQTDTTSLPADLAVKRCVS